MIVSSFAAGAHDPPVPLGQRLTGHAVAQLAGQALKRLARPREAVALKLSDRRVKWRRLGWRRQRLYLCRREDGLKAKVRARLVGRDRARIAPRLQQPVGLAVAALTARRVAGEGHGGRVGRGVAASEAVAVAFEAQCCPQFRAPALSRRPDPLSRRFRLRDRCSTPRGPPIHPSRIAWKAVARRGAGPLGPSGCAG